MTTSGQADVIREVMTRQGMSEDDLIEGCRQIVEAHEAAQAASAAEQERTNNRIWHEEVARQAQSSGDPHKDLMDGIIRNMTSSRKT